MISDEFLSNLSYDRRAQGWKETLKDPQNGVFLYVAENEAGEIVGFVSAGPKQQDDPALSEYKGEIHAIYLLRQAQGQGTGRRLMEKAMQALFESGISPVLLWVLKDNLPSRRFYEALGGVYLMEKPITIGQQNLLEVAYGWRDISKIISSRE